MAAAQQGLLTAIARAAGVVSAALWTIWDSWGQSTSGDIAGATFTLQSDGGSFGNYFDNDGGSIVGSPLWYSPSTVGIGASYWCRYTVTSGSATTNGASGWSQLSSNRSITKQASTGSAFCIFTIEIATDSIGSNVVFTKTGNTLRYSH